jgi:hypothetical protein
MVAAAAASTAPTSQNTSFASTESYPYESFDESGYLILSSLLSPLSSLLSPLSSLLSPLSSLLSPLSSLLFVI